MFSWTQRVGWGDARTNWYIEVNWFDVPLYDTHFAHHNIPDVTFWFIKVIWNLWKRWKKVRGYARQMLDHIYIRHIFL